MARKKIREYDSKRLLRAHAKRLAGLELPIRVAQVRAGQDFDEVIAKEPWLLKERLVVKPDCLFGKRGKHDLVGLNLNAEGAAAFVRERANKVIDMGHVKGKVDTFIVEPFVPHDVEYYMNVGSFRDGYTISFSDAGGIEIEENWEKVRTVTLETGEEATDEALAPLLGTLPLEVRPKVSAFLRAAFQVYLDLDMTLLEMNPFTLDKNGDPFPLDMRGELDDTAAFRSADKWGDVEFPKAFGKSETPEEAAVARLDDATGASLKLAILNPAGRVWTMVAGGGASVIYADTVGDLGAASELGNYAEYSGGPKTEETYRYARTLLSSATANPDGRARALIVGGGIANFTDVAATFKGIIRAFTERADDIKAARMRIYVRRGGPNYKAGLDLMRSLGEQTGISIEVHGPEASMTGICARAIEYIRHDDEERARAQAGGASPTPVAVA